MGEETGLKRERIYMSGDWLATTIVKGSVRCTLAGKPCDAELTIRYDFSSGETLDVEELRVRLAAFKETVTPEEAAVAVATAVRAACGGWVNVTLRPNPSYQVEVKHRQG